MGAVPFALSLPAALAGFMPTQIRRNNASLDAQSIVVVNVTNAQCLLMWQTRHIRQLRMALRNSTI
jgi:hypothetical protein